MRKIILLFLIMSVCTLANAQSDTIRYVKPAANGGAYANDGLSWAKAKDNIQDAINDLRNYLTQNRLHGGSVYVASGTYEPSEGVEGGTNGQLSTSFIIYEGIHVYGGFNPTKPEQTPDDRILMTDDRKDSIRIGNLTQGDTTVIRWQMKHPTVLSGNHNHNAQGSFTWNATRKRYDTHFPGNSYHVVYFASNGFINDAAHPGYADTLRYEARLDGFTVQDGNASGATDVRQGGRDHTAMGGGIYMVQNSVVENCIVQRCQAAMRGGGIYMDGGGRLIHSLVRECQTLGSGVSGGIGGGVCIDNNGEVRRSWITRNVARMGGGAAIISYPEDHPRGSESTYLSGHYDPYIAATLVTNNTSTTEAGGIYLDRGGVVNHVTVARNENAGRDISYGRTRYGRSGGVYIYGAGQVYNSVIWGNRCDANNDIQYAATTGVSIPAYVRLQQPFIGYTALNNLDITDFTGTTRFNVYSFESDNNDITRSGNFTLFQNPPKDAGAGIGERKLRIWYPFSKTSLSTKAVQLQADYSTQAFSVMSIARQDFFDKQFEPISTLGAIETGIEEIETAMVAPANPTDGTEPIPTIFVDPDRVFNDPSVKSGASWDNPLENISEAIQYFRENTPKSGKFQILVKQGTMTCAGIGAYYAPETSSQSVINLASIRMLPNLLLYGGYPSSLKGTSTTGRNPKEYPTRISGDLISAGYRNNALHVVSFSMAHDAVLDGFQLYYGNARNTTSEVLARGGGIVAANLYYPKSLRVNMTNNVVRNCVIANCSGVSGAAVFAGGSYEGANGNVKASLTMENCVINNNESATSIVHASGDASIQMSHCTIIGNVGPLLVTSAYEGTEGTINITNSAFHGNSKKSLTSINDITSADIPSLMVGSKVTGSNNLIDSLYTRTNQGFDKAFSFNSSDSLSYPTFTNPIRNVGVAENTADNTVYGGNADWTPLDMNPVVNRASTTTADHTAWGNDLTTQVRRDYGGAPDVGALECHQNNDIANGGQPAYGTVIYVRDYNTYDSDGNVVNADNNTTNRDGSSWTRAINGNALYRTTGLSLYNGKDTTINGLQYAVDRAYDASPKPEVWVAEGYYTNVSASTVNRQHYAYYMAEGVNVFGGFPRQGNPSMNERNPKSYVSVLQPQNVDPTDLTGDLIRNSRASVARVLVQPRDFQTETKWDGFTLRHGFLHSTYQRNIRGDISRIQTSNIGNAGGAGAYLMEKGMLENCELLRNAILVDPISDNLIKIDGNDSQTGSGGGFHEAGGGVYITTKTSNGEGGTLRNCVVAENRLVHKFSKPSNPESAWMYGAGVYQDKGIVYNTIIRDNAMSVIRGNADASTSNNSTNEVLVGAGAFLVSGQFYNNTIVHNTAQSFGSASHSHHILIPGIYVYDNITMYNSIVSDNTSAHSNANDRDGGNTNRYWFDIPVCYFSISGSGNSAQYLPTSSQVNVHYSYIDIQRGSNKNLCYDNDKANNTNIYLDYNKATNLTTYYTSGKIYEAGTYRLVSGSPCINEGTDDIDGVTIPSYDAAYADRVQDCAIDIGAYEYNDAELISPRESTEPHYYYDKDQNHKVETVNVADYFVNENGRGDRSANSPANAACATKLQRVLDAAGRYKYAHPNTHVVVRLEALPDSAGYTPSRSASTIESEASNPRSYSIVVPLGVELQGGWPLNKDFGIDKDGKLHGRDPINNVTRLTGEYVNGTENVNVYHVVTFTDQVFDKNGNPTGELLSDKIDTYVPDYHEPALNRDFDRAKLDGLYIEGGRATGTSDNDQRGAAAIVPAYAHISDCIVRNNQATGYGGAFYMLPGSAIEGSILENNRAAYGGAVAVAEADTNKTSGISSWALLLSNTIVRNTATSRGGGLWFIDNARTWNSVYWLNTSAEQNDISGITATTNSQNILNCPVNFCAVTNQTLAGNNNINLSVTNDNGTRWGKDTNLRQKHDYDFFLPSRASVLTRAGMPYDVIRSLLRYMPGIDSVDIAGVSRLEYTQADYTQCDTAYDGEKLAVKYNYNMEIGARALNQSFNITINPRYPLYRLFVAHPEDMKANVANALMESGDSIYSQQGSSFGNPFLRLTDALNYIVDARKNYPETRNKRFEVFIAEGTYQPFADITGRQEHVRNHTFVVPEKVTIIGGIDATNESNQYCQETSDGQNITIASGDSTLTLIGASTDSIRLKRERYDLNQNSVVEPWEMRHPSVLSGFSEGSDLTVKNVYHVITSNADPSVVGKQPDMYSDSNNKVITTDRYSESHASRGLRAIILDGITVTEGSATDYDSSAVRNTSMYFRGGGIIVAGTALGKGSTKGVSDMQRGSRDIPLVISNSLFQNNQARLGGAIFTDGTLHVVSSSFVQNLAVSPKAGETEDLENVTFSGGGAIASNDTIVAVNTIFANNEARDGGGTITIDHAGDSKRINISSNGKDANALRGFGGMIWSGDNAAVRLINCNSVRNKAQGYPSIYNCTPNTTATGKGHPHFGINCVFWGNQSVGTDSTLVNYGDKDVGALYFSAYQQGHGVPVTVDPLKPDTVYQQAVIRGGYSDMLKLDSIFGHANHNIIINSNNNAVDGPNFTLPSNEAGVDGYMLSADWVPSRINGLCDAGWGMIRQNTDGTFVKERNDVDLGGKTDWFVAGIYGFMADYYKREFNLTLLPEGDDKYMMYADESGDEGSRNMDRISSDPLGTATKDFIDIGVYEYQHTLLHIADGDEVDELWVSDSETASNNDGRSYTSPTSDLQRAIQTLLLSRNDHPKVIHVMQGTYSPIYELDNGNIGFQIDTNPNVSSVALRKTIQTGHGYQATSLTIMGGYSKDIEGLRDVNLYPTVLKMRRRDNASDANTAHLLYIGDAEQWETIGSIRGESSTGQNITTTTDVLKTSVSHGKAMPIVLDGLTFVNSYATPNHRDIDNSLEQTFDGTSTAGAAIYYREQFKSGKTSVVQGDNTTPTKTTTHLDATANAPKLTIRNCKFTQNGARGENDNTVPTVYIGQGGGKALIYNSLFNNNTGAPVVSADTVNIVNCTFAQNGGHITVKGVGAASSLSNSLIWRDDSARACATQYEGLAADSLHNNAITGIGNTDESQNQHNVGLSDTNADPMAGPNFASVVTANGSALDYSLNPGMRTLGRADSAIYNRQTAIIRLGVTDADGRTVLRPDSTWKYDLAWGTRLYGEGLERGAYECRIRQQRVLYVIPSKTIGTMTGTSWETAYGQGQLQTAIDAAAIYAYSHTDNNGGKTMAYVLVKGEANNTSTESSISLRDGVSIYGSVPDNYLSNIDADKAADNDTLSTYITRMVNLRPGVAGRSTHRSRVTGVQTLDANYSNGALLDGFEVKSAAALTQAAVNITQPVVLRSLIIDGNTVSATNQPAINMQQGLLYNSLVYGNKPSKGQPMLRLGAKAAVVNSTVVSEDSLVTAIGGKGLVVNSVTYNMADRNTSRGDSLVTDSVNTRSGIPFAPYLTEGVNPYALSSYITGYQPYHYQLHEYSNSIGGGASIDDILKKAKEVQGADADGVYSTISMASTRGWIDFDHDRDLLGNNRLLGLYIDRGCFETWRINKDFRITATANRYPHEGSVVYIMDDASLNLGEDRSARIFTNDNPFRPAFLLMRPGASLYGNGNVVMLSYVAVDRVFDAGQKYALISLPFSYKPSDILMTTLSPNGQIDGKSFALEKAQTYDGSRRAAWDYHFSKDNSQCWIDIDTSKRLAANAGWLATLPDHDESITLRLVGYGEVDGDNVYTENGSDKSVTLTQYDNRPEDGSAHFTKAENMGWNIAGLPYLVSNYRLGATGTSEQADAAYQMNIPHVVYCLNDNGTFTTEQSWQGDAVVSTGYGFMTQTAVSDAHETVTFALPTDDGIKGDNSNEAFIAVRDGDDTVDKLRLHAAEDAKSLQYTLGSDGVKWMPMDKEKPSIYAVTTSGTPLSLSAATPVETDIPVVISGKLTANAAIAISDTANFNTVNHVWLKDDSTGYVVDLKQEPLRLNATHGSAATHSFTLRLGDTKPDGTRDRGGASSIRIYLTGRTLHIDGLKRGDIVSLYTISGQLYHRDVASSDSYTCTLHQGVYVVRAGGKGQAVAVK